MPAKSVFFSHSSKDDATVRRIRQTLESFKIEVWADSERLSGGDLLGPEVRKAIEKVDHFLVYITVDSLSSEWVFKEIAHAQSVRKTGYKVIPLVRTGLGTPLIRRVFGEEPVAIWLGENPAAISDAVHEILAAIGEHLPTESVRRTIAKNPPVADLMLELKDPVIEESEGKRRASATAELTYVPADGSPKVESERYRFTSPLGPIESEEISWYLERYVNWPAGYFEQRAQAVVDALPRWGRLIYDAVDAPEARPALEPWKAEREAERRFTIRVDKKLMRDANPERQAQADEAATLLLSLPWELIHDEHGYLFQGKRPIRVRRTLPNRERHDRFATEPPIRVLLVSPRPEDESAAYIDHRVSARPLVEELSRLGDLAHFHLLDPPTFPALEKELERASEAGEPYHVVHFDGHGVYDRRNGLGKLCFEDPSDSQKLEQRRSQLISADEIARIVREYRIPLFFLEACQTARATTDPSASVAGRLLESGVASVAAMSHSVLVETARRFIAEFYRELLGGRRVGQAMLAGQRALKSDAFRGRTFTGELRLEDWFVPVLFQEETDPQLVFEAPAREPEASDERRYLGKLPAEPPHQFLGRSRDLLKAERILAQKSYLVVQGSGGEGKTTFAAELARWMVATRRFERAAFTSVEQVTESRQVLFSIGAQLVSNFASQVGTDDALGRQLIARALREHRTLLVIDNMESILANPSDGAVPGAAAEVLDLCDEFTKVEKTQIVFTSREALPEPFADNLLRIGRLDRETAIRLLSNVLSAPPEDETTAEDLEKLVQAVGGHARSLVLIGREVGLVGVRHAAENLRGVMRQIEAKHPGERENSLLASAELSLRRLPQDIRQLLGPLSVFQCGGVVDAIAVALKLDPAGVISLTRSLVDVGLAEYVKPGYLQFDQALIGEEMTPEERGAAISAWSGAVAAEIEFLSNEQFGNAELAASLTLLDLGNLLVALDHLARNESPERTVGLATSLEQLIGRLNRPKALARIVEIRERAATKLGDWVHAQFQAESSSVERLLDQGRLAEAVEAARALHARSHTAGEDAYSAADYDMSVASFLLGRALKYLGDAAAALTHLIESRTRFEALKETRMTGVAINDMADCLSELGRHKEAAEAYLEAIKFAEEIGDQRQIAVCTFQLATTRLRQKNYSEALKLYDEVLASFELIGERQMVARAWHQIGCAFQENKNFDKAELAYQNALAIKVEIGDRAGQSTTLNQLANLNSSLDRSEDAVRFYRQSADISVALHDKRAEGRCRYNIARVLMRLKRFREARTEIEGAIECDKPFGHVVQPWMTFSVLSNLEAADGNYAAALRARHQALEAYLSYRHDGGAPVIDIDNLTALAQQDPAGARAVVDDPEISYAVAAEILLLLEQLEGKSGAASRPN